MLFELRCVTPLGSDHLTSRGGGGGGFFGQAGIFFLHVFRDRNFFSAP